MDPGSGGGVDPSFVENTDGSAIDVLAATVVTDVQKFWTEMFPAEFDKQWSDLDGGYYSVDTSDDDPKRLMPIVLPRRSAGLVISLLTKNSYG